MIRIFLQQSEPPIFQCSQRLSADITRKQFGSRHLQTRLGGYFTLIELFQPLAPPGQLYRTKRRLGGLGDDIAHGVVDGEQSIERRPQFRRPVEPDEIAILRLSDR